MCPSVHILQQPKSTSFIGQTTLHTGFISSLRCKYFTDKSVRSTFLLDCYSYPVCMLSCLSFHTLFFSLAHKYSKLSSLSYTQFMSQSA